MKVLSKNLAWAACAGVGLNASTFVASKFSLFKLLNALSVFPSAALKV